MSRLSIDITPAQHRQIKALAALEGLSLKAYVRDRLILKAQKKKDERVALKELNAFLETRLAELHQGKTAPLSFDEITVRAKQLQ